MSLLGDTPFLDQLASSTSLLTDNIAKTDTAQIKNLFGNYNPNVASDYVYGPMGGIAQNRFDANQFQLPYQPGEFTTFGGQFGSGGFNLPYTPGGYTPGQFNQYGNVPVTGNIPSNVTTTMQDRGGRGDYEGIFKGVQGKNDPLSTFGNQKYRYETIGGRTFKIDSDTDEVTPADMPFNMGSILGLLGNAIPGAEDYRLDNMTPEIRQALQMANAEAINKEMTTNPDARRAAVEKEFMTRATQEQKDRLAMSDAQRGITTARPDPSNSRQGTAEGRAESRTGTNKARNDASKSSGVKRGFMGGK